MKKKIKAIIQAIRAYFKHECIYTKSELKKSIIIFPYARFTNEPGGNEPCCKDCGKAFSTEN